MIAAYAFISIDTLDSIARALVDILAVTTTAATGVFDSMTRDTRVIRVVERCLWTTLRILLSFTLDHVFFLDPINTRENGFLVVIAYFFDTGVPNVNMVCKFVAKTTETATQQQFTVETTTQTETTPQQFTAGK
uniref:Uncharacterized protein n=1 Tax=Magallana gigas TaxID=29159 RepID=K1Q8N3_MAGGI